jgi:hypothetical protein
MLTKSGHNPPPCVTRLLVLIGSEIYSSLHFIHIFYVYVFSNSSGFKSCVGVFSTTEIYHNFSQFKLYAFS